MTIAATPRPAESAKARHGLPSGGTAPALGAKEKGVSPMEQSHVSALQLKHAGLERQIQDEMSRPMPDHAMLQALKKQKLRIKEELAHN
jgi:hypothetical protein